MDDGNDPWEFSWCYREMTKGTTTTTKSHYDSSKEMRMEILLATQNLAKNVMLFDQLGRLEKFNGPKNVHENSFPDGN